MTKRHSSKDLADLALVSRAELLRKPEILTRWLSASSPEVRFAAAERLTDLQVWPMPTAHRALVGETHPLVRLQLIEAAGAASGTATRRWLWSIAAISRSPLERAVAVEALAETSARKDIPRLRALEAKEVRERVLVSLAFARFRAGDASALPFLVRSLRSRSYLTRCAAASILGDETRAIDISLVVPAIQRQLKKEPTVAARSSLERALAGIEARLATKRHRKLKKVEVAAT